MDFNDTIVRLRALNDPGPRPRRLPTELEVREAETRLGVRFHPDLKRYLLEASDISFGTKEPVTITDSEFHTDLVRVTEDARRYRNLPTGYVPICEDNSDLYCVTPAGAVVFRPHDGTSDESWPTVTAWIDQVWIGENLTVR